MIHLVDTPYSLEATIAETAIQPNRATELSNIELRTRFGRTMRRKGYSRSDTVGAISANVIATSMANKRDCRKIVFAQDDAGNLNAHYIGSQGTAGQACVGPLPSWYDVDIPDGAQGTYVQANDDPNITGGTTVFSNAIAGKSYKITGNGLWSRDASPTYLIGPQGENTLLGFDEGVMPAGSKYSNLVAIPPGGSWQIIGKSAIVQAVTNGDIKAGNSDNSGLYGDNIGYIFVIVEEL